MSNRKRKPFCLRMSQQERSFTEAGAAAAGLSLGSFLREAGLERARRVLLEADRESRQAGSDD